MHTKLHAVVAVVDGPSDEVALEDVVVVVVVVPDGEARVLELASVLLSL